MKPFSAPLDDILFSLEHIADAASLAEWDGEFAAEIGGHFAAFAEGVIAPLNEPGDRQGCRMENGRVFMPDGFADAYGTYAEQGWAGISVPEEFGGQGLNPIFHAITSEIFSGANHSLQMVAELVPGAVRTLMTFGSDAQKQRFIPAFVEGRALATMCLTEPGAGSDLSRIRCKAKASEGTWAISGEKIFISGGDQNLTEEIVHLVLARTSDDGLKGLSLFVCPSKTAAGTRNRISVTRIEEKMGLHASPTCQLAFDNAEAELLGEEGKGLLAMFTMMNHARTDVALQGVAHAARAFDIAKSYAAERRQGRLPDGTDARLDQHADVQRMLLEMDQLALGGRAIAHLAHVTLERGNDPELVEFLTPIAKVYCSEAGIRAADLGIQILGGYGYLSEYQLDQTYRDARITAIYEGANGIHARSLATRLVKASAADAFDAFLDAEAARTGSFKVKSDLERWRSARGFLVQQSDAAPYADEFMRLTSEVLLACLWERMARSADQHPDPERIKRLADLATGIGPSLRMSA